MGGTSSGPVLSCGDSIPLFPASVTAELEAQYPLDESLIRRFREQGFIKLPGVFSTATLPLLVRVISDLVATNNPVAGVPMEARDTYGKAFIQVFNLWRKSAAAQAVTFAPRLARIATELLGTGGVRLWHDQALFKEPAGGFTPWHADQQYWPMESGLCVTAWIPLHGVPLEQGPLAFAPGTHIKRIGHDLEISDDSERLIREAISAEGISERVEPFAPGEVSFHLGWTLHRAGPNTTTAARRVHTVIYMDEGMRLSVPRNANQQADHQAWTPSTAVGEIMDDPLNPILYHAAVPPSRHAAT